MRHMYEQLATAAAERLWVVVSTMMVNTAVKSCRKTKRVLVATELFNMKQGKHSFGSLYNLTWARIRMRTSCFDTNEID